MDVVYNHTTAAGQDDRSVLDRVVPGYYHRLLDDGAIATSTCCANTASEHAMMEKLLIDSVVTWARDYKVDGFRFDLMGHHSKANMLALRAALDELTLADDGVDGSSIYALRRGVELRRGGRTTPASSRPPRRTWPARASARSTTGCAMRCVAADRSTAATTSCSTRA